jgi:RHS repeat-associated protein
LTPVRPIFKFSIAIFLNLSLLVNQLSADLQQITFDSAEWIPLQTVGVNSGSGWWLDSGNAVVSPDGAGFGGGKALRIPANSTVETKITRSITWDPAATTAFIDFQVKPAADPVGSLASIHANGTQIAFQVPQGSNAGDVWIYQGNDGVPNSETQPEEWIRTVGSFPVATGATMAGNYLRVTFRHDYQRNLWDLFIDGKLAAANLSFEGRGANLQSIDFYGSLIGDTHVDNLAALTTNMLFPDADKDGLSDAWETANGSNPNLYDRDAIKPGANRSFLDLYMDSLWLSGGANGSGTLPSSSGIPPLTIDSEAPHQAVGAMKGSLSVGGDGSASYSVPIDIPKGTAGMEPKLSLNYSSSGGNGMMGLGWNLGGLQSITRGASSHGKDGVFDPMDFDENDRFFLNGERLVCISGAYGMSGSEYRTEIDSFARITAVGVGPDYWKVETKAGLIVTLGGTPDSKVAVPQGVLSWSVNQVCDTTNNYYSVEYAGDVGTSNQRVAAMHYTGNATKALAPYCHVYFDYESRPDGGASYSKYAAFSNDKRLSKIRVLTNNDVNHSYVLSYTNSYQSGRSLLASISKRVGDNPLLSVPATVFSYDGLREGEPLWRTPAEAALPVYGVNLDANGGGVNSFINTSATDDTMIELTGDVARSFRLSTGDITLYPDTCIQFDFQSENQVTGSIIGLDGDMDYQTSAVQKLVRVGGTGSLVLNSGGSTYSGATQPYTVGQGWKTFNVPIGASGASLMKNLVLMCVDKSPTDGTENAIFRNIRIYRSGIQQPSDVQPIHFPITSTLPVMFDSSGKDLGVVSMDFDNDGLPDLTDWRVCQYFTSSSMLWPTITGGMYRNIGEAFASAPAMLPPWSTPLGVRTGDTTALNYVKKHHFLGQPLDVNGDGKLDLLSSGDIEKSSSIIKNEYTFFTCNGDYWEELTDWKLPFQLVGMSSSQDYGTRRDEHFQWTDLNSDGYPDLMVHTTSKGLLYNSLQQQLLLGGGPQQQIAGPSTSVAYINKGKNGPGWIRDDSYALPVPLMVNQKDVGRRLLDVDGDGMIEVTDSCWSDLYDNDGYYQETVPGTIYRLHPTGTPHWTLQQDPFSLPTTPDTNKSGLLIADLNGDGMPDCFRSNSDSGYISNDTWLNSGGGTDSPWNVMPDSVLPGNTNYDFPLPLNYYSNTDYRYHSYGFEVVDLNGDGLTDVLYSGIDNTATPGVDNLAVVNSGSGWNQRPAWGLPGTNRIFTSASNRTEGKRSARLQEINGDGFPDLLTDLLGKTPRVWYNNCRPEVLKTVTDGFGSELKVEYSRLNDPTPTPGFGSRVYQKWTDTMSPGHNAIIDARLVVSSYSESDGNGGRRVRSQRYGDLRYDRYNESSLGFGWVEAKDHLNNQTTRTETSREFPFGGSPLWTRTWVEVKPGDLSTALPGVTAGTKCLSEETAIYAQMPPVTGIAGGTIRRPVQTQAVKTLYDLCGKVLSRTTTAQNLADFDAYGFVKYSTSTSLDGTIVASTNAFTHTVDANRWHLGRLSQAVVTKQGAGKPTLTKTSAFTYDSANGLLKTETVEPGNALSVTKAYTHDGFGNVIASSVTGSGITRSSTSVYDSQGRFVLAESNQLGHTVSYNYDSQRALLLSTTDIAGKTTAFGYDAFGTVIRAWHPDGTQTGESTGFADGSLLPPSVAALVTNPIRYYRAKQSSSTPVGKVYLDALGREIVAESTILRNNAASGSSRYSKIYTVSQYDVLGRKTLSSEPFGAGDTPLVTRIRYDLLSRVAETIHPDAQSDSVVEFSTAVSATNPLTYSKVKNARNGVLERWEDQQGRLIKSRDPSGQITTFRHDHEGRILSVAINGATLLTNNFDLFGNKIQVNEVNSGTSSSVYNALGEVTSATNAKGQVTTFAYDILGRATTVARPEGTYTTAYDGARGSGLGKPWKTTGPNGYQETVSYDNFGRARSTNTTRFNESFSTSSNYDALGRPLTETDAGGLTVVHEYDPNYSIPTALRIGPGSEGAGTLLWQAGTFDSKGRAITQTLAQGVSASATYHAATGLLATMNASQGGTTLQAKSYAWDSIGNLTARNDTITARGETFSYDTLNRVTGSTVATLPGSTISTVPPPTAYTYATNGNLLSKPGLSNVIYGGPRPHAVTSATVKGVARSYAYDAAGYVTADGKRTYNWTSFGQLSSLDYLSAPALQTFSGVTVYQASRVQSDFSFDAGGNRAKQLKQRIAANDSRQLEETLYLGSYEREIHMTKASAAVSPVVTKTVHRHNLGGFAVYTKTAGTSGSTIKLSTILKDHLGSTDLILTSAWNGNAFANPQSERQSFDSWGERRAADTLVTYRATDSDPYRTSAQDYDRGYTGHEQLDDSGLIHMNGRIYDPELGRMLSPDPVVQVPEYSQNFNRYSYVMNNPLNLTDPSGFSWLSNAFHKLGSWLKENWRTVVVIVVVAIVTWGVGAAFVSAGGAFTVTGAAGAAGGGLSVTGLAAAGAIGGAAGGGLGATLNGGSFGDVLRGAAIGAVQGAITGGMGNGVGAAASAGNYALAAAYIVGHGVVGGAVNVAMGGKFQDGFLSAAAGAASQLIPFGSGSGVASTIKAGVIGGSASSIGGGKFANGAYTAAFQYLITVGLSSLDSARSVGAYSSEEQSAIKDSQNSYNDNNGGIIRKFAPEYSEKWGFSATMSGTEATGYTVAFRGTQMTSLADWYTNILQAFGIPAPQYTMAKYLAKNIYEQTGGNVRFVGHSLGGGLASASAMVTGARAITINAAGLNPWTASGGNPNVSALFIRGDILSFGQDFSLLPKAYGQRSGFNPPRGATPIGYHSSDMF